MMRVKTNLDWICCLLRELISKWTVANKDLNLVLSNTITKDHRNDQFVPVAPEQIALFNPKGCNLLWKLNEFLLITSDTLGYFSNGAN